jgi:hypothetical protein
MNLAFQRLTVLLTAALFLLFAAPHSATAQDAIAALSEPGMSRQINDYGRAGYPRVRVYLWGNVNDGVWTVEEGTDLLEFLSASATGNFNQSPETRVRNILKIYRNGQVGQEPAFEMNVETIFARQDAYPTLQNGDVLVVESIQRRRFFTFRNISQVTGTVASVASLIFLVNGR